MKLGFSGIKFWQLTLVIVVLVLMQLMVFAPSGSANITNDQAQWVTVCHSPTGNAEDAQTMVIYWSVLDTCLSHFNDTMGPCP